MRAGSRTEGALAGSSLPVCFLRCEHGGFSTDWLALGAGILLLGMLLNYAVTHNAMSPDVMAGTKARDDAGRVTPTGFVVEPGASK